MLSRLAQSRGGSFLPGFFLILVLVCPWPARCQGNLLDHDAMLHYLNGQEIYAIEGYNCIDPDSIPDLFFLSQFWYDSIDENSPFCDCDIDRDDLNACEEAFHGTDPEDPDTDDDCLGDGLEVFLELNPLSSDTIADGTPDNLGDANGNGTPDGADDQDEDTLPNCDEVAVYQTNPLDADTDDDLLDDGEEVSRGTDPLDSDSDDDGFIDGEEVEHESDPLDADSLPVDPNKVFGIVTGLAFSILNDADPTGELYGETFSLPFAVLNDADPSGEPLGHVWGPLFSIENQADQ